MRELRDAAEVGAATDDRLVRWGAQALTDAYPHARGRAWRLGDAVAVFAPKLNRGDRLVFTGSPDSAADLLAQVMPRIGVPTAHPLSSTDLALAVAARAGFRERTTFGWMELETTRDHPRPSRADWLPADAAEAITSLMRKANPGSYLFPDDPGAHRWAGVRDAAGRLVAVAADAWSAPGIGCLAGVTTHPDHRGEGLATQVCSFVTEHLSATRGDVVLMVDGDNVAAINVYRRLGFEYRSITSLAMSDGEA